jgi:hypothetical protein
MKKEAEKMLTTAQFAEHYQVAYTTVMTWLQRELIPGAKRVPTPRGEVWEIPAAALQAFTPPKQGRPKKEAAAKKAAKKPAARLVKKKGAAK